MIIIVALLAAVFSAALTYHFTDARAFADGVAKGRHEVREELQAMRVDDLLALHEEDLPPPCNVQLAERMTERAGSREVQGTVRKVYPITVQI